MLRATADVVSAFGWCGVCSNWPRRSSLRRWAPLPLHPPRAFLRAWPSRGPTATHAPSSLSGDDSFRRCHPRLTHTHSLRRSRRQIKSPRQPSLARRQPLIVERDQTGFPDTFHSSTACSPPSLQLNEGEVRGGSYPAGFVGSTGTEMMPPLYLLLSPARRGIPLEKVTATALVAGHCGGAAVGGGRGRR